MSTTILAIRHAKPLSDGCADETLRPLHKNGILIQKKISALLKQKKYTLDTILSSPILRAKQTADILAEEFAVTVEETQALGYAFDSSFLLSSFPPPETNQTIALVGHAPSLGEFVNALAGKCVLHHGLSKSGTAILEFQKEIAFGKALFIEYLTP